MITIMMKVTQFPNLNDWVDQIGRKKFCLTFFKNLIK